MRRVPSVLLACAAVAALGAGLALGAPGDTTLVSLTPAGTAGAAPADPAAVSADGRYVAFTTGAVAQLFVRDRVAGTTALASSNAAGAAANAAVDTEDVSNVLFAISGNGRYVVFASSATNLTPLDTDTNRDVFRKDLVTGAVDLIPFNSAGQKANLGVFGDPDVSYDGNRVSFGSGDATNLFPADTNNSSDIVVRDVAAGTTVLAAQSTASLLANGTTERSAISADGRAVVFEAPAGTFNLVPGDVLNQGNDAIVRNLATGTTTAASDPTKTNGSGFPDISGDGRFVVFSTGEPYDAANDANAANDVYRRDMTATTNAFTVASAQNTLDTAGNAGGDRAAISADGSRVSFTSASVNLTAADGNAAVLDVYTRDIGGKVTARASSTSTGPGQSDTDSARSAIGGAGSLVTFVALDAAAPTRLVPTDTNLQPDILAKELAPTDTTGPPIQITSTTAAAGGFALVVTATDPSGVGSVIANGVALRPGAGTTFSGTAPVASGGSLRIEARDGSGNAATLVVVPATTGPGGLPTSLRPPKLTGLRAKLVKGKIVVTLRLDTAARVRAQLLRRTVKVFKKAPKRRVVIRSVGKAVTRTLAAGSRTITVTPPKLRRKVKYTVRVRAATTAGTTTRTVAITVPAALRRR